MKCPQCQFENPPGTNFCGKCAAPLPSPEKIPTSRTKTLEIHIRELTEGSIFAGRYEVIEELGSGGMGRVYHVLDKEVKEEVALKLLRPEISCDEDTIERFRNELKFARKISHRNVCRMYDFNKEEETQYITMEYVPGEDLKNTIRGQKKLNTEKAILIARQVCEGLAEAHRLGVIHRDLKPQNIMIDKEGNAHIMDFGIARSVKADGITITGVIIGTPDYMSPEQVEGETVDQRSDIYSLGTVLYEMVTGRVPFKGKTPLSTAVKHKTEPAPNPRNFNARLPEEVSRIILKCMEKDKIMRYQKVEELLTDLVDIEKDLLSKDRVPYDIKFEMETSKKSKLPIILFLIAISIVAGYFFYNQILLPEKKEKEEKPAVISEQKSQKSPLIIPQLGSLEINSTPRGAKVYINSKREGVTPLKRELKPGTYKINIKKDPEYKEITDNLYVKAGETSSKNYTLTLLKVTPQQGNIEVDSTPGGAEVYVGSKLEGMTPLKLKLNPGTYRVRIKKGPDYREVADEWKIKGGEAFNKNYTLNLVYILDINSDPKGADVKIDGNYKGKTPIKIELSKRRCQMIIEKGEGWFSINESLSLKPGLNFLQRTLERSKYNLSIKTNPPGALVSVGGKSAGESPVSLLAFFGRNSIKIEKEGYRTFEEWIDLQSDLEKKYDLVKLELVKIRLKVSPYANVFIDGKSIGEVPPTRTYEIEKGKHTIEFVHSELNKKYTVEVEIKAGESKEIRMNMNTGKSQVVNIDLDNNDDLI